jgi:hypothetical protein
MAKESEKNPWLIKSGMMKGCITLSAEDRISRIGVSTNRGWLRSIIAWPEEKITVRTAAQRRLNHLKMIKPLGPFGHPRKTN